MRSELPKITRTLRGKLSLWYLSSVGLIILIFLTATSLLFWITLQNQIDHHVHTAVTEAAQIVQQFKGEERDELLKNLVSTQGMTIIVLSPDGAPVLETNSPGVALVTEHQLQGILTSMSLYESEPVHFTEGSIRFAAMPVQISAGKGILAVGYSTQVLSATFMKMLIVVTGIIILLVLPITLAGYKLLKKQLQPLEGIADQAKTISNTSSLSKRIRITSPTQELETIQKALNTMLSQLENVFRGEHEFFSDAAHALKTPLAALRSQIENSSVAKKPKAELLATMDQTSDTIQDLLFLAKIGNQSQTTSQFLLSDLMADLAELATTLGEDKGLIVTADIQKDVYLQADKKLLRRALSNVVHNAVAYNRSRGSIKLLLKEQSDKITIEVSDTGLGIKKSDQSQTFTRFFRGSNITTKGSGLGLAITKAVIENFGGEVSLKSTVNKGTTVTITF